jgi:threonine-phosphate decarboxylase
MIDGHGDDIHHFPGQIRANFSSNVWPCTNMPLLERHLCEKIATIQHYPEPDAGSLLRKLADFHDLTPEHFRATNGATEAIYLIAQTWRDSASSIVIPAFSEDEDAARIHGHSLSFTSEYTEIEPGTDLLWICDPNNPTGKACGQKALLELAAARPEMLLIIDQSYVDFTEFTSLDLPEAVAYPNVIIIRSTTKRYSIPGLRLGYIAAHPSLIEQIAARQMPWSVNALAIEAALFLMDAPKTGCRIFDYLTETRRLQRELQRIDGLEVFPGDTPFFLCRLKNGRAADLKRYLAVEHGLLIRDASNFRGLDEGYFRIYTLMPEENDWLVNGIKAWMSTR